MAVLAAAATIALVAPLVGGRRAGRAQPAETAVYRDQLAELDRDREHGLIGEGEAASARAEIARRLIHARPTPEAAVERPQRLAVALVFAMPLAALALYLVLGAPMLPDQPLASRAAPAAGQDIAPLVAAVEARLASNPEDGRGWEVIAPVYERLGRDADAAKAYRNALRLLGSTAQREGDFGEALVRAAGGKVTPEARDAFARAAKLAAADPRPKYYAALALTQDGQRDQAMAAWRQLLSGAAGDAPWIATAKAELAALEAPGPSAEDILAAARKTPAQRDAMIRGMVDALASRLADQPDDADGWSRLLRSYVVLGDVVAAHAALDRAKTALSGAPDKLALVESTAHDIGLDAAAPQ